MDWKTIRLELARSPGFPQGSAGRAFLVRVPLDEEGFIDGEALERNPRQATVRRFWTSEPDQYGQVERANGKWIFRTKLRNGGEGIFQVDPEPFRLDGQIVIRDPLGDTVPFRVANIQSLGTFAASRT